MKAGRPKGAVVVRPVNDVAFWYPKALAEVTRLERAIVGMTPEQLYQLDRANLGGVAIARNAMAWAEEKGMAVYRGGKWYPRDAKP